MSFLTSSVGIVKLQDILITNPDLATELEIVLFTSATQPGGIRDHYKLVIDDLLTDTALVPLTLTFHKYSDVGYLGAPNYNYMRSQRGGNVLGDAVASIELFATLPIAPLMSSFNVDIHMSDTSGLNNSVTWAGASYIAGPLFSSVFGAGNCSSNLPIDKIKIAVGAGTFSARFRLYAYDSNAAYVYP